MSVERKGSLECLLERERKRERKEWSKQEGKKRNKKKEGRRNRIGKEKGAMKTIEGESNCPQRHN